MRYSKQNFLNQKYFKAKNFFKLKNDFKFIFKFLKKNIFKGLKVDPTLIFSSIYKKFERKLNVSKRKSIYIVNKQIIYICNLQLLVT